MKHKKLYALSLSAMLLATPLNCITTWAQNHYTPYPIVSPEIYLHRFSYIQSGSIKVDPSNNGVNYSVNVSGISEVRAITGSLTIYKNGSQIFTKRLSSQTNILRASGTIPSEGSGSYTIVFSGTVYTATDSESIDMDMVDSY